MKQLPTALGHELDTLAGDHDWLRGMLTLGLLTSAIPTLVRFDCNSGGTPKYVQSFRAANQHNQMGLRFWHLANNFP